MYWRPGRNHKHVVDAHALDLDALLLRVAVTPGLGIAASAGKSQLSMRSLLNDRPPSMAPIGERLWERHQLLENYRLIST